MTSEGYIKFSCNFTEEKIDVPREIFNTLNHWRNILRIKGWIGTYPDGIGFGNISVRIPETNRFYITGSATGNIPSLDHKHYSLVEDCDIEKNTIWCRGLTKASSESMSHYVIYQSVPKAGAVVHIHNLPLWKKYLDVLPTTRKKVAYGTPEMAYEIRRLLKEISNNEIIVMGGHTEGIISYSDTLGNACDSLIKIELI
jgi:hypothetical protein